MIPLIFPSYLGEHYQLLARGHKVFSCGIPVTTIDAAYLFSIITRELTIPVEQWRGVLMHLGIPVPRNFFHTYDIYHELVKLCQRGDLRLVKIPRLERLPAIATGNGWGYCFIRGPQPHPQDRSPVSFNSMQEAQNFVSSLNVGEKELRLCTHRNPALAVLLDRETDFNQRFIEGLANKEILAYKVRVGNSAPAVKPLEYMPATAVDREVPPPPSNKAAAVVISEEPSAGHTPPETLEECGQRLEAARERLATNGYQSKYTDAQVRSLAQKGELDDRFVVRLIETKYAGDAGYLGQMTDGKVKYWSTTFNQMENADTDPATLCALIGVEYRPGNSYTLVIVDTQAAGAGQAVTIVPTHKNLREFAKREIKGIDPKSVDEVMTPKYNQEYAEHMKQFKTAGGSIDKQKDINDYVDANFHNDADKACFEARIKIHERLGANENYTGDGTTKNLIAGCENKCGVMETFTYDKSPQTLGQLEASGSAKRISMKPL